MMPSRAPQPPPLASPPGAVAPGAAPATGATAAAAAASERLDGFGNDIPLAFALQQIVPDGFLISYAGGVDKDLKISWKGGSSWRSVLAETARQNHLTATVDGQSVRIAADAPVQAASPAPSAATVPPADHSPAPAPAPAATPAAAPQSEAPPGTAEAPKPKPGKDMRGAQQAAAAPAARTPQGRLLSAPPPPSVSTAPAGGTGVWHAAQGETLDQVLGDWGEKSGWKVVVNTRMIYELQASADFRGDFIEASSALIKSIQAKPQPLATFYRGNHALVISNAADQAD